MLFQRIIAGIVTFFMLIGGTFAGTNHGDTIRKYNKNIEAVEEYENTVDTAVPQTEIYRIISEHFNSAPESGKKVKKAIVIGYDGCRADTLKLMESKEESGILTLLEDGGNAVISYCGGKNYPKFNTQATSTAPGWCSMLTGVWADEHGIKNNSIPKSNDHLTLLTTLVEDKTIDSSAFYVSWGGHFSAEDATYYPELKYNEEKGLNVNFLRASDDNGTFDNVMTDIKKAECSDFIFSIFEYTDHTGHGTGFGMGNSEYCTAFSDAETHAKTIIDTIKARPSYAQEDWLIIITSDHGGYNTGHGNMTIQERMTFIVSNKNLEYKFENTSGRLGFGC